MRDEAGLAQQRLDIALGAECRPEKVRTKNAAWLREAIEYWSARVDESDIGVDWEDAEARCWRCGDARSLQRCHVVARQFGGGDEAANVVALCAMCHDEMPDVTDSGEVWRWIKQTKPLFYGTLRAERALAAAVRNGADLSRFDAKKLAAWCAHAGVHMWQEGTRRTGIKHETLTWLVGKACGEDWPAEKLSPPLEPSVRVCVQSGDGTNGTNGTNQRHERDTDGDGRTNGGGAADGVAGPRGREARRVHRGERRGEGNRSGD